MASFNEVNETERIYYFHDDYKLVLENVIKVGIGNTSHRVETRTGNKFIIPMENIRFIQIFADSWSF